MIASRCVFCGEPIEGSDFFVVWNQLRADLELTFPPFHLGCGEVLDRAALGASDETEGAGEWPHRSTWERNVSYPASSGELGESACDQVASTSRHGGGAEPGSLSKSAHAHATRPSIVTPSGTRHMGIPRIPQ